MSQIALSAEYEVVVCCNCAVAFGLPTAFVAERRRDHADFYCPNGHTLVFRGKSDLEKLREEVAAKQADIVFWQARTNEARDEKLAANRSRNALKGQVTKIKRRVGSGLCPCCNRTFRGLARHMAGQHPHWAHEDSE